MRKKIESEGLHIRSSKLNLHVWIFGNIFHTSVEKRLRKDLERTLLQNAPKILQYFHLVSLQWFVVTVELLFFHKIRKNN